MIIRAELALYKGPPDGKPKAWTFRDTGAWAGKHIGHRGIQLWFLSIYSHAEIKIADQGYSSSARDHGVRHKPIDFYDGKWDLFPLPGVDVTYALEYHKARIGWGYDWHGVAAYPFPRVKHDVDREFCFEHVGGMLQMKDPHRLGPYDLVAESIRLSNVALGIDSDTAQRTPGS